MELVLNKRRTTASALSTDVDHHFAVIFILDSVANNDPLLAWVWRIVGSHFDRPFCTNSKINTNHIKYLSCQNGEGQKQFLSRFSMASGLTLDKGETHSGNKGKVDN